jgi:hypothetical protein
MMNSTISATASAFTASTIAIALLFAATPAFGEAPPDSPTEPAGSVTDSATEPSRERNLRQLVLTNACMGCDLSGVTLTDANLQFANLTGTNLEGADLTGANLTGANLTSTFLTNAFLANAQLDGVNFSGARLYYVDVTGASMNNLNLAGAQILNTPISVGGDEQLF